MTSMASLSVSRLPVPLPIEISSTPCCTTSRASVASDPCQSLRGWSGYTVVVSSNLPVASTTAVAVEESTTDKKQTTRQKLNRTQTSLYVNTRNSNIYTDEALTDVLYEADFGDGYRILEASDSISKVELTDELTGYIKKLIRQKSCQVIAIADETLLTWVNDNLDTSFVTETLIDLIGKSREELNSALCSA